MTPIKRPGKFQIVPGKMYYFIYPDGVLKPTTIVLLALNRRENDVPQGVVLHVENRDSCNDMPGDIWPMDELRLSNFIEYHGKITLTGE